MASRLMLLFLVSSLLLVAACDRTNDASENEPVLEEDVAATVAATLSQEGGGAADQLDDVSYLSSSAGLQMQSDGRSDLTRLFGASILDTSYNDATGWWTATLSRSRSSEFGQFESSFERIYQFQFLNNAGTPQRRYIVGTDTAYTINFKIVSGTGYLRSPVHVHILESLTADWVVTNANRPVVIVNGSYARSGKDTITTRRATRTHENQIQATFINVTRPRYRFGVSRDSLSGTITGTIHSVITFTSGDLYRERIIDKEFTVELSGEEAHIGVGGRIFRATWRRGLMVGLMH